MKIRCTVRETLGFDDLWIIVGGILLVSFVTPLLFFRETLANGLLAYLPIWTTSAVYTTSYWLVLRRIWIFFQRRYPSYQETSKRLLWTAMALLPAFFLINFVIKLLEEPLGLYHKHNISDASYTSAAFVLCFLILSIYEGAAFFFRWKKASLEAESLRRDHMQSQLESLKNQVNPHFLFNSLNTLSYLIPEDANRAVNFVQQLSRVYRYILEMRDQPLIQLRSELQFLDSYLLLLHERFGDNLQVVQQIDPRTLEGQLPPLTLQLLIENAIKHNIISQDQPLLIEIIAEDRHLLVRNRLQVKRQQQASTRVGLSNISNRFSFFTAEPVLVRKEQGWFSVQLPLLMHQPVPTSMVS